MNHTKIRRNDPDELISNTERAKNLKIQLGQLPNEKRLKRKKIKSPTISGRVHVKGSTFMVPKRELKTDADVETWRQEMISKYGL